MPKPQDSVEYELAEHEPAAQSAGQAIPELVDAYSGPLYGLGLRLCGNPQDAEDMVQETFLNAYRKWDQFEGRASSKTWLYTIATRVCSRMHRPRSGQPKTLDSLESLVPQGEEAIPDPNVFNSSPFRNYLKGEAKDTIGAALAELEPEFRMPVILRDILGLSINETAEILDIKPATVKTRSHRARLKLRERLMAESPSPASARSGGGDPVCRDLLRLKLEALDEDRPFPVPEAEISERCRSLCESLDLTHAVCVDIGKASVPEPVRARILDVLAQA